LSQTGQTKKFAYDKAVSADPDKGGRFSMAAIDRAKAENIIGHTGWLAQQPESFRAEVLRRSMLLHFAPGDVIYRFGDPLGGIYGLVSGLLTVDAAPPNERPLLFHLAIPGFWTGEGCFLTRQPRRVELRALAETTMMHLPLEVMDQMVARDPDVTRSVAQLLMINVDILLRIVHDLQKSDAARRIASVLQRAAAAEEHAIPISQTELGTMANASRKQVNAVLQRFVGAGWVTHSYRSISITQIDALRRFAAGDDAER
jgi:CRP/FNR family transcriptional regulator, cyclic AMP receptor protein